MQVETLQWCVSVQFRKVVCSSCRCVCRDVFVRSLQAHCRIAALAVFCSFLQDVECCSVCRLGSLCSACSCCRLCPQSGAEACRCGDCSVVLCRQGPGCRNAAGPICRPAERREQKDNAGLRAVQGEARLQS